MVFDILIKAFAVSVLVSGVVSGFLAVVACFL